MQRQLFTNVTIYIWSISSCYMNVSCINDNLYIYTWMLKTDRLCKPSRFWSCVILLVPRNKLCKDVSESRFSMICEQNNMKVKQIITNSKIGHWCLILSYFTPEFGNSIWYILYVGSRFQQFFLLSYPDAVGPELQHLQACEMIQVGNAANFVVKQKKFLQLSQLLQTFHLP